jgi:hypothetical protein
MSDNKTLQLSGTENVWWYPRACEIEFHGPAPKNSIHSRSQVIVYPAEFALQILDFLKSIEEELMLATGVDIPSNNE